MKIKDSLFRSILEFRAKRQRSVINKNINSNAILVVATVFFFNLYKYFLR